MMKTDPSPAATAATVAALASPGRALRKRKADATTRSPTPSAPTTPKPPSKSTTTTNTAAKRRRVVTKAKAKPGTEVKAEVKVAAGAEEPFPAFNRPSPMECATAVACLAKMHGFPSADRDRDEEGRDILDALVGTILSQNTTDVQSHKGMKALKAAYPDWEQIRKAPAATIEAIIRSCGLAEIKTERIQMILNTLHAERGECSLEHLRSESEDTVKKELLRFKGVGPKTVACVLMFAMNRAEFPVDTHVWRISKNQGWAPKQSTRETCYSHMNARVPDKLKYDLHCLLVTHGKRCHSCAKNGKPRFEVLGPCPLAGLAMSVEQLTAQIVSGKAAAREPKRECTDHMGIPK